MISFFTLNFNSIIDLFLRATMILMAYGQLLTNGTGLTVLNENLKIQK